MSLGHLLVFCYWRSFWFLCAVLNYLTNLLWMQHSPSNILFNLSTGSKASTDACISSSSYVLYWKMHMYLYNIHVFCYEDRCQEFIFYNSLVFSEWVFKYSLFIGFHWIRDFSSRIKLQSSSFFHRMVFQWRHGALPYIRASSFLKEESTLHISLHM